MCTIPKFRASQSVELEVEDLRVLLLLLSVSSPPQLTLDLGQWPRSSR